MINIFGINIPYNKPVRIGLTAIYGIGFKQSAEICNKIGIPYSIKIHQLKDFEIHEISKLLKNKYLIEGDLKKETHLNIKRLIDIGTYRGIRHRSGLPVRGQRTHTNAKTQKQLKNRQAKVFNREYSTKTASIKTAITKTAKRKTVKRKTAVAYIQCTFNNIIITITKKSGDTICWSSGGHRGLAKGSKRSTAFAGQTAGFEAGKKARSLGFFYLDVIFKGFGRGRNSALKGLQITGFKIKNISDETPLPHNGCRPKKKRRI
jgi:small subunit ribosomal protein S13